MPPLLGTAASKYCTVVRSAVLNCAIFRKTIIVRLRAFIDRWHSQPTHLGIFLLGWKTDITPAAHRMVARSEIVHVQVALVQKRATAAHFRMGIGDVLQDSFELGDL
jgi:hypothetical protein